MHIPSSELQYIQARRVDELGEIFEWKGKILRGIYPESVYLAKSFFKSGFLDELQSKGIFPKSSITSYTNEKYGLIIEHEVIDPIIYPQEWDFNMLKKASLMVLETARTAMKYGFNMKDCHKMNVLFSNNRPVYVDLGSFYFNNAGSSGWTAFNNFLTSYYYILFLWKDGLPIFAKQVMFPQVIFPRHEYYLYRYKLLRKLSLKQLIRILKVSQYLTYAANIGTFQLNEKLKEKNKILRIIILNAKKIVNRIKISRCQRIDRLENKIARFSLKTQKDLIKGVLHSPPLNDIILEEFISVLSDHCSEAKSAILLGTCEPFISNKLLRDSSIKTTICINADYPPSAFEYNQQENDNYSGANNYVTYNFFSPIVKTGLKLPCERFESDIIVISDILHLIYSNQGLTFDLIFAETKKYARQNIIITFSFRNNIPETFKKAFSPNSLTADELILSFEKYYTITFKQYVKDTLLIVIGKISPRSNEVHAFL